MRKKSPREIYRDFRLKQLEELYSDEGYTKRKAAIEADKKIREQLKKNKEHQKKKELLRRARMSKEIGEREKIIDELQQKLKPNMLVLHRMQACIIISTQIRERDLQPWEYERGYEYAEWLAAKGRELWVCAYMQKQKQRRWVNAEELEIPNV
jgi:cell fate (sporulation/competence/biofilm development) regulator YmcA (YheA/YmcA/DUF963 family)